MVLSSQQARPGANRSYLTARRKRRRWRGPATILVIVGVGVLAWFLMDRNDNTANASDGGGDRPAPGTVLPADGSTNTNAGDGATLGQVNQNTHDGGSGQVDVLVNGQHPGSDAGQSTQTIDSGQTHQQSAPPPIEPVIGANSPQVTGQIQRGRALINQGDLLGGRALLSAALQGQIAPAQADAVRKELAAINETLVFSPRMVDGDPLTEEHVVQAGEYLSTIARKFDVPWQFVAKINNIPRPELLRQGARLKMVKGPFHAVVDKSDFRMDLYLMDGDLPIYVRSYPVGLGAHGSTPLGAFVVRQNSKLINPEWPNPRTGKIYLADDPANPIGERWIGLRGTDPETELLSGYGIHGTIEPQSIGRESSMGCVRMLPKDVEVVFTMLAEGKTTVQIQP